MDAARATPPSAALEPLLCNDLYVASRAMTTLYRGLLAPFDLTYPQYLVLVVLWDVRTATVRQLADRLRLDYGTLTPLLQRLQARGLLTRERSRTDERAVLVGLTTAGAELQQRTAGVQPAVSEAIGLPAAEVTALQGALRELTVRLGAPAGSRADVEKAVPAPSPG